MPKIVALSSCSIHVYAGDHAPPHFHIRGADTRVSVNIVTLEILKGKKYSKRDLQAALEWAVKPENRKRLLTEWSRLNGRD